MSSPISQAIRQVCEEKGLSFEAVLETLEAALAAAYRKDFGQKNQNIKIKFDPESGSIRAFDVKTVVEDMALEEEEATEAVKESKVPEEIREKGEDKESEEAEEKPKFNPKTMIMISEARKVKPDAQTGEEIRFEIEVPHAFGRVAAQTAKQVIIQRLREAERQVIYEEFKSQEGEVINGVVGRREGNLVFIDLGRTTALMPGEQQNPREIYKPGTRLKFYIASVGTSAKGPEIIVSRAHPEMLKKIFTLEIPEIQSGMVEIKNVAREPGNRSKVAVFSRAENIDPIGACIGQRGSRIQMIINEIGGEKIDVIKWEEDPVKFIGNALSPAKILEVNLNEEDRMASVKVGPDQLSLAIGRAGQNVYLASLLTGWKIVIEEGKTQAETATPEDKAEVQQKEEDKSKEKIKEGGEKETKKDAKSQSKKTKKVKKE